MKKVFLAAMTTVALLSASPLFAGVTHVDDQNVDPIHIQLKLTDENLENEKDENLVGGVLEYKKGNFENARQYFEKIAETNVSAAIMLGHMYRKGEGVEQDFITARKYFLMGEQQENGVALFILSCMESQGEGGHDPQQSLTYLQRAANAGHGGALIKWNNIYQNSSLNPTVLNNRLGDYYTERGNKN